MCFNIRVRWFARRVLLFKQHVADIYLFVCNVWTVWCHLLSMFQWSTWSVIVGRIVRRPMRLSWDETLMINLTFVILILTDILSFCETCCPPHGLLWMLLNYCKLLKTYLNYNAAHSEQNMNLPAVGQQQYALPLQPSCSLWKRHPHYTQCCLGKSKAPTANDFGEVYHAFYNMVFGSKVWTRHWWQNLHCNHGQCINIIAM